MKTLSSCFLSKSLAVCASVWVAQISYANPILSPSNPSNLTQTAAISTDLHATKFSGFATEQVAGFYRFPLGQFQITALYDGDAQLPITVFKGASLQKIQQQLKKDFIKTDAGVQTSVNAYLINTGDRLILVDSGAAKCFGDSLGSIEKNLHSAGYRNEQIGSILLTHLHPDHVCGITTAEGKKVFPNATVYVNQQEANFWLNDKSLDALSKVQQDSMRPHFKTIQDTLKPYQQSQQFKTFKLNDSIESGIKAVATYGHTAGHTSYLVQSDTARLLILGDLVHQHNLQFKQPEINVTFDLDPKQAIQARKTQFALAAKQGDLVAGAHLPFPGVGHIQQVNQTQYAWLPVQYQPNVSPQPILTAK